MSSELIPFADPTDRKFHVRVYHADAACGCCGHIVQLRDDDGIVGETLRFSHPILDDDKAIWARELAEEVIPSYWPECGGSVDWTKLDANQVFKPTECENKTCRDDE